MSVINEKLQLFKVPVTNTWTVLVCPESCTFIEVTGTVDWKWRSHNDDAAASRAVGTLQPHVLASNIILTKGEPVVEIKTLQPGAGELYIKVLRQRAFK